MYRSHSSTFICTYDCVYYHVKCEKTADLCKRMISARASFALPVFPVAHVAPERFSSLDPIPSEVAFVPT